ncbi:nuclear transport factor 2 family protein [Bradyrhizobium sp. B117]|uniref:nuclear transport factor 2 family protein n=1 Tax=Bradyrhizobium sp. B117 TaxID=3140246 RepID=UPI0031845E5E
MYADDAVVYCDCDEVAITGREGLRAYWAARLRKRPATELDDLQPSHGGILISYISGAAVVNAVLSFNAAGKIKTLCCGPSQHPAPTAVRCGSETRRRTRRVLSLTRLC